MKKLLTSLVVLAACVLLPSAVAGEDNNTRQKTDKAVKLQATCPVMGGKINKDLFVDHDGKRVYVCCKGCIGKVKADPEKYIKKIEAEGKTVASLQTSCPVMGGKINKDLYVDHEGKRIYVCCEGCIGKVKAEPEKYIKKLAAKGEVPAKVAAAGGEHKGHMKEGSHKKEGSHRKEGSHHR